MTRIILRPLVVLLAASGLLLAQPQANQVAQDPQMAPPQAPAAPAARDAYGQAQAAQPPAAQPPKPAYGLPPQVTLKSGSFVTIRINQPLASNKNAVGDTFTGSLTQPLVADGIVVAQRGQMVYGRVVEADKVKGVSRLGVEITSLTLADGSPATLHSQLISRQGPVMPGGMEAGVITSTTVGGAAVGAAAAGGTGAAAGAGIGAAAGVIGVLATHNHPSVIYPETMLTFQTEDAITINTANSAGAYRYVGPDDYSRPTQYTNNGAVRPYGNGYVNGAYPYPYPYYYPYYGWGPFWGPSLWIGGGFGFRGGFRR